MTPIKKTFQYGQHTVTLETGEIARQASGAVIVNMADTVVLVTMVAARETEEGREFLPLPVPECDRAAGWLPAKGNGSGTNHVRIAPPIRRKLPRFQRVNMR